METKILTGNEYTNKVRERVYNLSSVALLSAFSPSAAVSYLITNKLAKVAANKIVKDIMTEEHTVSFEDGKEVID